LDIQYHPGKANVVADALSRKAHCYHLSTYTWKPELKEEIERLNLQVVAQGCINTMTVQPTLEERIKEAQKDDEETQKLKFFLRKVKSLNFVWMDKELYGTKTEFVYQKKKNSES